MNIISRPIIILISVSVLLINIRCTEEAPTNIQPEKGSIFFDSNPQGAEIFLQNTSLGKYTPATIQNLAPDSYEVKLKFSAFTDTTLIADVKAGLKTSVFIDFSLSTGNLFVSTNPENSQIYLNGINTGETTPETILCLTPGDYEVNLKFSNGYETSRYILIESGITKSLNVSYFGAIYLRSNPSGAEVFVDGLATGEVTPTAIGSIVPGQNYNLLLKLNNYYDTTFVVNLSIGEERFINVDLVSQTPLNLSLYGPVRIYETAGTTGNEPTGLDLSNGMAYGINSTQNGLIDIYYSSNGFLIQSANLYPSLIRETDFLIGSSDNLFDEQDSPLRNTGTWTNNISDREYNYVFLYDYDGHYSKLKIVDWGGGVPGEPAWVEVQWYFNETTLDNRF